MVDLSQWDYSTEFSAEGIACLIAGVEPTNYRFNRGKVSPIYKRISDDFELAKLDCELSNEGASPEHLSSVMLEMLGNPTDLDKNEFVLWMVSTKSRIGHQEFSREEIVRWLSFTGMKSVYPFDCKQPKKHETIIETDIDPADLPEELSAANIAFRAVTNGYGDPFATFKNRLIDYLENTYSSLNNEAVQRIATVANPDKGRGRKKSNLE